MRGLADARAVPREELPGAAATLRSDGWRFVTATCLARPGGWLVLYHFERAGSLRHLRVSVDAGQALPAIDTAYPAAFLVENEIAELHGLPVHGMAIDYGGRLYRDLGAPEIPPRPVPPGDPDDEPGEPDRSVLRDGAPGDGGGEP